MSVFQVVLNNLEQGTMDYHRGDTVVAYDPSLQRQVYVMGPKKINRLLRDGDIFEDCNYWKIHAPYHAVTNPMGTSAEKAFIEILVDDGSVYSDNPADNTFAFATQEVIPADPVNWTMVADFADLYGSFATSAIITNSSGNAAEIQINGSAAFPLAAGATQVLNTGDISIVTIEARGAAEVDAIEVFAGVRSMCRS